MKLPELIDDVFIPSSFEEYQQSILDSIPFHTDTENTNQIMSNPSPITKLPDGSAFFTATIMSKEEAMALPVEKRPICFRISDEMYQSVFESIGAASMCWKPRPGGEVFQSEQASDIAVKLCFKIAEELESRKCPDCGSPKRDLTTPKYNQSKPDKGLD